MRRIFLEEAIDWVVRGEPLLLPTDTLYGIALPPSKEGVRRLEILKGREEAAKPIPLLIQERTELSARVTEWPPGLDQLIERFWPGALTLVLPASLEAYPSIRAGRSSLAFRQPAHRECRALLEAVGPLAVSSANQTGEEPAQNLLDLQRLFPGLPYLASSRGPEGVASTVVSWEGERWKILREGAIASQEISLILAEACATSLLLL